MQYLPTAYGDESGRENFNYVMAVYIGTAQWWKDFEAGWNLALEKCGLTEWHADHCEDGIGEFAGRDDREELKGIFAELIHGSPLYGVAVALDLRSHDSVRHRFAAIHDQARQADPYMLVWQRAVQYIAEMVQRSDLPSDEVVNFVFDSGSGYEGHTVNAFKALQTRRWPASVWLGNITHASSYRFPGLQAADYLAFETRKATEEIWFPSPSTAARPQYGTLMENGRTVLVAMDKERIDEILDAFEEAARQDLLNRAMTELSHRSMPHIGIMECTWDEPWARVSHSIRFSPEEVLE